MPKIRPLILVVDEDEYVRKALRRLLEASGVEPDAFASARDVMNCGHHDTCNCLVLNLWLADPRCAEESDLNAVVADADPPEVEKPAPAGAGSIH